MFKRVFGVVLASLPTSALAAAPAPELAMWSARAAFDAPDKAAEWNAVFGRRGSGVVGDQVLVLRTVKGDGPPTLWSAAKCGRGKLTQVAVPKGASGFFGDGVGALAWNDKGLSYRAGSAWKVAKGGTVDAVVAGDGAWLATRGQAVVRSPDHDKTWTPAATLGDGERLVGGNASEVYAESPAGLVAIDAAGG